MTYRAFAALSALALLASASAFAQSDPIKFDIPFAFHVGDRILPAGKYSVTPSTGQTHALTIRGIENKTGLMVLTDGVYTLRRPSAPTLEFMRYGRDFFLERFQDPGYDVGRQLHPSKTEMLIAAKAAETKPHLIVLAAR